MIKNNNKIVNITKCIIQDTNSYYLTDKTIVINGNKEIKLKDNFFGEFYVNNGELVVQSFYGSFVYNDIQIEGYYNYLDNKEVSYINKENGYLYVKVNDLFVKTHIKKNLYHYHNYYNLLENSIICYNLLFPIENILWQYDLSTKYNWQQKADYIDDPDVEKQAEVIKFLGVYKNELWLVLNNGALLALDIETGTESRYIKEGKMIVGESDYEDFKGYFGYDTVIDEENGLIFNLSRHFYIEYNLKSENTYFDSYSFKESSQKHKLNLNYVGGFDEEYIYSYEGSDNNRFAIFSREKKEIIWSSEIEEVKGKFPAIRDLQYGAGKIYVLDHDNTLHIFERE